MTLSSLDTNILVYAFQPGPKRNRAFAVLEQRPAASVQLLNEYAHLSRRKFGRSWTEIEQDLKIVRSLLAQVLAVTDEANRSALRIAARYQLSFYDALMLAVALTAGAEILFSEDMQHGLVVEGALRIIDPFRPDEV